MTKTYLSVVSTHHISLFRDRKGPTEGGGGLTVSRSSLALIRCARSQDTTSHGGGESPVLLPSERLP